MQSARLIRATKGSTVGIGFGSMTRQMMKMNSVMPSVMDPCVSSLTCLRTPQRVMAGMACRRMWYINVEKAKLVVPDLLEVYTHSQRTVRAKRRYGVSML